MAKKHAFVCAFIISVICVCTFYNIYTKYYNNIFSYFFKLSTSDFQKTVKNIEDEIFLAERIFESVKPPNPKNPSICIAIPTIPRKYKFLSILMASLLRDYDDSVKIILVNAVQPGIHTEAESLSKKFGIEMIHTPPLLSSYSDLTYHKKETLDYIIAMKSCMREGIEYILILEDDVKSTRNIFQKLQKILKNTENEDWAIMKLFVMDHLNGYSSDDVLWLISFGLIMGGLTSGLLWTSYWYRTSGFEAYLQKKQPERRKEYKYKIISLFVGVGILIMLFSLWCILTIGKQNLFPRKRGIHKTNFKRYHDDIPGTWLGTQAHVYHPKYMKDIVEFLEKELSEKVGVDLLLIRHAAQNLVNWYYGLLNLLKKNN